jgi:uncharacterized membrane protein YphA (DoxX/SURF4 family)
LSNETEKKPLRKRAIASLVASIIVGIVLLAAGSGKLFGFGELPGQTIDFIAVIIPEAWQTPGFYAFIGDVFFPYLLPVVEMVLGILLIVGFIPRLMATLTLPLAAVFLANNAWSIHIGMDEYPDCVCFGIWEHIFGVLTPFQSMFIDIGLILLAIVVIVLHPGPFMSSRAWLARLGQRNKVKDTDDVQEQEDETS